MMVIRGTTTRHATTAASAGITSPNPLVWEYEDGRTLRPNTATATALTGFRITGITALASFVGATASGSAYNNFIRDHVQLASNNDLIQFPTNQQNFATNQQIRITPANLLVISTDPAAVVLYPADRCTWRQFSEDQGYSIDQALFFDGTTAGGTAILEPALGYIGKSGRFVEIAG